jgi:hypothetical protein
MVIEFSFSTKLDFEDFLQNQSETVLSKIFLKSSDFLVCVFQDIEDPSEIYISGEDREEICFH